MSVGFRRELGEQVNTWVFTLLDAESDITGPEAGRVAAIVEAAFNRAVRALDRIPRESLDRESVAV